MGVYAYMCLCVNVRATTDVATSIDRRVATARRVARTESESRSTLLSSLSRLSPPPAPSAPLLSATSLFLFHLPCFFSHPHRAPRNIPYFLLNSATFRCVSFLRFIYHFFLMLLSFLRSLFIGDATHVIYLSLHDARMSHSLVIIIPYQSCHSRFATFLVSCIFSPVYIYIFFFLQMCICALCSERIHRTWHKSYPALFSPFPHLSSPPFLFISLRFFFSRPLFRSQIARSSPPSKPSGSPLPIRQF